MGMYALSEIVSVVISQLFDYVGDRRRIRKHIRDEGGQVLGVSYRDFTLHRGHLLSRVYEVRSRDLNGLERCGLYRTSFWLGTWKYSPLDELRNRS
jgi:hypothetical protein